MQRELAKTFPSITERTRLPTSEASHNHRIIFNSFISITLVEEVLQYSLKVAFEKKYKERNLIYFM